MSDERERRPGDPRIGVAHVGLTVDDIDAALSWYVDVLRMRLISGPLEISSADPGIGDQVRDVFEGDVRFRQAHLLFDDGAGIELFEFVEPGGEQAPAFAYWRTGFSHLCVVDPDIEALVERIRSSAGRVRSERIWDVIPGEPYRMCFCEDPSGNVIEVYSHPYGEVFTGRRSYQSGRPKAGH